MALNKTRAGWADIKTQLAFMDKAELLRLVKDLHNALPSNKAFLAARFLAPEDAGVVLEQYRQRVITPFFPKRGFGKLNLADARKAIREYCKARGDLERTLDLMLTYVENGTRFTYEYGDISEAFYYGNGAQSRCIPYCTRLLHLLSARYIYYTDADE